MNDDLHHAHNVRRWRYCTASQQAEQDRLVRGPSCCGMPMAYSGQSGWYCLKCGATR